MASVGINAHLLAGAGGYRRAGIHHYIAGILQHMPPVNEPPLEYTVFTRHAPSWRRPDMHFVTSPWPTERRLVRILWEQLAWPLNAVRRELDLLHSMAFVTPLWQPCPAVVTVYDLSFLHYPEQYPPLQRLYLKTQTRRAAAHARRLIAISTSARDDIVRLFGVPAARIDVAPPGVDPAFQPYPEAEIAAFRRRHDLPERFILHVGTLQPRKNIPTLLEALARLRRPEVPLILVGGKGWMYDQIFTRIEALGLEEEVRFAGYVADETLPLWYNAASLFVFPSLYEGFGMPVVEAMACGTPVVAADSSSIPEAAGDAALLFAPNDLEQLVSQMLAVLDNESQAATMRERGLAQAKRFSWARSGQITALSYRQALAK